MAKLAQPKVFVVVPVFERLAHTLRCIADLEAQTYPNLEVVVVDGGSRDGSVEALRQIRAITVIADVGEQWWTGATWFGVEHALAHGAADDFVMLLNNDTSFAPDMVDVLVSESHRLGAVVAPIARAGDGDVVNSGVSIDWKTYGIVQRHGDPNPPCSTWPVDALEGRATLVPLHMVRAVGNVARDRLPHHAADYEFSIRLHRHGYPIFMTNSTSVTVDWDAEGVAAYWGPASIRRLWWEATDRRSFVSLRAHFGLIDLAGPPKTHSRLKATYLRRQLSAARRRSTIRNLTAVRVLVALRPRPGPARGQPEKASRPAKGATDRRVFAIVPVFERADRTRLCVEQLKRQTHPNVEIVVVDGGSCDGSLGELRATKGITLIADIGEQWWTGSTSRGVEYALDHGDDDDLALFLNDDTTMPDDLVAVLAEEATAHRAAVEALQVDEGDHSRVLFAGALFDWRRYRSVPLEPPVPPNGFDDRTEVLDGRATMVPLAILRQVGNVRPRALPHYCADSELFFRIARAGYPLAVTHRTWIATAPPAKAPFFFGRGSFTEVWRSLWDRRSMSNLPAHLSVILLAGPTWGRWRTASRLLFNAALMLLATFAPLRALVAKGRRLASRLRPTG